MRRRRFARLLLCVLAASCNRGRNASESVTTPGADRDEWFVDRAAQAGLDFVHVNGMSGRFYLPEIMGSGVALFDYDNDGDLDVYLVQSGPFDGRGAEHND